MKETRLLMGMPITVEIAHPLATLDDIAVVFTFFTRIDETFSTYKEKSEISRLNRGEISLTQVSPEMQEILYLCDLTQQETQGYFNIRRHGHYDPSGLVKGWAIHQAAGLLREHGWRDFFIDAGGDIQVEGCKEGRPWRVGIRNPFKREENVKVLSMSDRGIATSGTAIRGQHIYNPYQPDQPLLDIVSLTVIGPNIYEADRFATAAFAMGREGIRFLAHLDGFEGYMIDAQARAVFTSGFERYVVHNV